MNENRLSGVTTYQPSASHDHNARGDPVRSFQPFAA